MYMIQRKDGMYVARSGSQDTYTKRIRDARIYSSRQAAERDLCVENERVMRVSDLIGEEP